MSRKLLLAAIAAACLLPCLYPGDVPWINDEPLLIDHALRANHELRLENAGLEGTHGMHYGGFPTWTYQALLAVTHDLKALVVLHALLWMGAVALGLWWLSLGAVLQPWFIPVVLLSPYLWLYSRMLWDITNIPLSALAIGSLAALEAKGERWALLTCLGCCAAMVLSHLNSLPFVVPVVLFVGLFHVEALRKHWHGVAVLGAAVVAAGWPYFAYVLAGHSAQPANLSWAGFVFPLGVARLLGGFGLDYFFGQGWLDEDSFVRITGSVPALLVGVGALLGAVSVCAVATYGAIAGIHPTRTRFRLVSLAFVVLAAQMVLDGVLGVYGHPHYYASTWMVAVLFAWVAVGFLKDKAGPLLAMQATASLLLIGSIALKVHRHGGVRGIHYGSTLDEQIAVADQLAREPMGSNVALDVPMYPQAVTVLQELEPDLVVAGQPHELHVAYAGEDLLDAHLAIERH